MARRPFLISFTFSSASTSGSSARPRGSKGPPAASVAGGQRAGERSVVSRPGVQRVNVPSDWCA